jgi:Immunoglobulin-like domain of bacterial spore germination
MTIRILLAAAAVMLAACSPPAEEEQAPAPVIELATVDAPAANARATSPLAISGSAPSSWYFEEQFDAVLIGDDGTVFAQAPARASGAAQGEGARPFTGELTFSVSADTPATLLLQEQSAGEDDGGQAEVRVPVVLTPPS